MREIKSDKIFLKVEPSLKKAAQELAEENGKTLSGYICWLLEREADKKMIAKGTLKMSETLKNFKMHLYTNDEWEYKDYREFSYAIGYAVALMAEELKQKMNIINPIVKAAEDNDTDSVKEEIRKIFTQYIKIKGNDVESHVNILISHIMVANLKLDPSMILAGSTAKKI